jgi:protein phosphatase
MLKQLLSLFSVNTIPPQSVLYQHSIVGDREYNEDAYGEISVYAKGKDKKQLGHFLIVCDGMGGHVAGDVTSQALVECFIKRVSQLKKPLTASTFQSLYEKSVAQMQQFIITEHGKVDGHTTLACAWLDDSQILTLHAGDSRIYQLNAKAVSWRSRDHSIVQILLDEGEITEDEMGTHPDQNRLFKSISVLGEKLDKPSIKKYPSLVAGESILVCSDGFWEHLTRKELVKLANNLSQSKLEKTCLRSQQRAAGKSDNITVLMYKKGKEG